jgi:adenylosuccinate synthase
MTNRVVIGTQWGDEGKAKVVDFATEEADIIIRFQGGANAGHTVEVGEEKFIFHMIPSGIMRPDKVCVVGNGVVFEPEQFLAELDELKDKNIDTGDRIVLSDSAHVVIPYHKEMDKLGEKAAGRGAIGTTGRGIGPTYMDKVMRSGLRTCDLLDQDILSKKLTSIIEEKNRVFKRMFGSEGVSAEEVIERYTEYGKILKPYIRDTVVFLNNAVKSGKRLLFEGAQGTMLDIDHGTYPFVTSSNTTIGAVCTGSGVGPGIIDQVIGIVKAYTTRVGNGPFPSELTDATGDKLQEIGAEFGATTGRRRRCGWLDAVVLRKSAMINGITHLAVTKMDVLDSFEEIKVCTGYKMRGKTLEYFPSQTEDLEDIEPVYEVLPGWNTQISKITQWEDLPENARKYLEYISQLVEKPIGMVSVGPKRHQTVKGEM